MNREALDLPSDCELRKSVEGRQLDISRRTTQGEIVSMAKPDFPALLPPGLHTLTLPQLHALAVAPFPLDTRRQDLFDKLSTWTMAVHTADARGVLWLDGSFLTQKPGPDDIDCVLWNPEWATPASATPVNQLLLQRLLDKPTAKAIYGIDFYLEMPEVNMVFHRESYWRGVLGFAHDRVTAKGFAELHI